jgi:hypothetical protein
MESVVSHDRKLLPSQAGDFKDKAENVSPPLEDVWAPTFASPHDMAFSSPGEKTLHTLTKESSAALTSTSVVAGMKDPASMQPSQSALEIVLAQYPVLRSIAKHVHKEDVTSLALTSKDIYHTMNLEYFPARKNLLSRCVPKCSGVRTWVWMDWPLLPPERDHKRLAAHPEADIIECEVEGCFHDACKVCPPTPPY